MSTSSIRLGEEPVLVWFREDLRLQDHPALHAAVASGHPLIAVYCAVAQGQDDYPGAAWRWWLHHSLASLSDALAARGGRLVLLKSGCPEKAIADLLARTKAVAVYAHESLHPVGRRRQQDLQTLLKAKGATLHLHQGQNLLDPQACLTGSGTPYKVFTPFWKAAAQLPVRRPVGDPGKLKWSPCAEKGVSLEKLGLLDVFPWFEGWDRMWQVGEKSAHTQWRRFRKVAIGEYSSQRDYPAVEGTSKLSPHLAHGEIDPARLLWDLQGDEKRAAVWVRQLWWREFARHLMWHFPHTLTEPFHQRFRAFPWRDDPNGLRAWQRGNTGFAFVDAAMRQLWQMGWMHNRARMVVASFLTKDLLVHWRYGADWFRDTLVDGEDANNIFGWQWVAGCGADGAPFFRIFNPETQGLRWDPKGEYVGRWGHPLLEGLAPIVDHSSARIQALAAYSHLPR